MANYVSQVKANNTTYDVRELFPHVGSCSDAAATAAKTVTIGNFKLYTGAWVVVKFANTNTASVSSLTLNVDGTGAKSIKYKNANLESAGQLAANRYMMFVYDGSYYQIVGEFDPTAYLPLSGGTLTGRVTTTKFLNDIITGTGTAAQDKGSGVSPRYFPAKWTFNTSQTPTNGDIIVIKIPVAGHDYGVYLSIDNGTTYYPVVVTGTSRLTSHYPNGNYLALIFKSDGSAASMFPLAGGNDRVTVSGGVWQAFNYYDSGNTYDRTSQQTRIYAGGVGVFRYSICAMNNAQRMEAFTTTGDANGSPTTTKQFNTSAHFMYPPVIMYQSQNATYSNGSVIGNNYLYEQFANIDLRYSCNKTSSSGFAQYKPVYLECTLNSDNTFSITANGLTQTFVSGKYYILLGCMYNTSVYQLALFAQHPMYYYDGSNLVGFPQITQAEKTKLAGIAEGATKVEASSTNGKIKINGTDTTVYTHPTATAKSSGLYKITVDGTGHVTDTASVAKGDIPALDYVPNTNAGVNAAINLLSEGTSNPQLTDYYVSQYAGGGTTTTSYHRRPISALWNTYKALVTCEVTGDGNAVTTGSFSNDGNNRKLTLTKGSTFSLSNHTHTTLNVGNKGSATNPVYFSSGAPTACTYSLGSTVSSGTAKKVAYYSANNTLSPSGYVAYDEIDSTASTPVARRILHIYGPGVGNDAASLISGTAGVISYGDGGPQINFNTASSLAIGGTQDGALIFTDHDTAATGVSWHFVSNQTDWNVISKRFHARTSISIGTDLPNTSYNLYVNGTTYLNGNATVNGILTATDHKTATTSHGYYLKDSSGTEYGGVYDNGSNLWIGSTMSTSRHHKGQTYISTGWTGTLPTTSGGTLTGNSSILISVPKYTASSATAGTWDHTAYFALHSGNFTTTGSGNAVTSVAFDSSTQKLTFTKGSTFLTSLPSHTHAYTVPPAAFAVQTGSTKQSHITLQTLMTWLITTKAYITSGANRSLTLCTTWSYADNDILQLSIDGVNYELQLAGVIIEFYGSATSYNAGMFRLRIHSSPTVSFTPASGYTQFPASHIAEYTCNGSSYSPVWKMIIDRADISNGTSTTGNGTISVAGKAVSVYGLGSAAYTASTAYLPSTTKYAASASVAGPANLLAYSHGNEINFSGGKQATCYFNYRDADTDAVDTGETPVSINYKFCDYRNSTAYTTITAANFDGNASTATKWKTARTLTIGSTGKSVDGSGNVSWSLSEIGAAAASHTHDSLAMKTLTSSTIDTTAGTFGFKGTGLLGNSSADWAGFQVDASDDRFQLTANNQLLFRQNDDGTMAGNWSAWVGCITPNNVSAASAIKVTKTTSTVGTGDGALTYYSGVKIEHDVSTSADTTNTGTLSHGGTFTAITSVTRDSYGHVTTLNTKTYTLPGSGNTDTKVNVTLGTTTKAYVLGTSTTPTSSAQAVTSIADTGVYLDTTAGMLTAKSFNGALYRYNPASTETYANAYQAYTMAYYQTSAAFAGTDGRLGDSGDGTNWWAHYITMTHTSNYRYILRLPFWGPPQFQHTSDGTDQRWFNFITDEHVAGYSDWALTSKPMNPVMMPLTPANKANKLAFMPADKITIQYSTNGGSSWTDMGTSANAKRDLFISKRGSSISIGPTTGNRTVNMQTRVIIENDGRDVVLDRFVFYLDGGYQRIAVDVYVATASAPDTFVKIFTGEELPSWMYEYTITIPHSETATYRFSSSSMKKFAFVFRHTYVNPDQTSVSDHNYTGIFGILGFSGTFWGNDCKSYFANYDHLYNWDRDQKAYFPSDIYSNSTKVSLEGHTHNYAASLTAGGSALGVYTASIGSGATSHASALQTYFNENKNSINRNVTLSYYSSAESNGSVYMGYFLAGYNDTPYGGFFVAHYNKPQYVGIQEGTFTKHLLISNQNYTDYTVKKDGTGATGSWGINVTGTSSNVTGTVAIANGGTGATTRLNALKALTNESVGTSANYFLTITTSWGKGGYTSVADAKTVLGLKSAAYTESSAYAPAVTGGYLPLSGGSSYPMTGTINFGTVTNTIGALDIYTKAASNYVKLARWSYGSTWSNYGAEIGFHNQYSGDTPGTKGMLVLLPYQTTTSPWNGTVGLAITKDHVYIDNVELSKEGHTHSYAGSASAGGPANSVATAAANVNADRVVFFADNTDTTKVVYDNDFKYNPSTNILTTKKVLGALYKYNPASTETSASSYEAYTMAYYQTSSAFAGTDGRLGYSSDSPPVNWAHYITMTHSSSYRYILRLPFWGAPQYQHTNDGADKRWYNFITDEHIEHYSAGIKTSGTMSPEYVPIALANRANKLMFIPAAKVTIQYSSDGGSTWSDASVTNNTKSDLFIGKRAASVPIGPSSGNRTVNMRTRVIIESDGRNAVLDKFVFYVDSGYHKIAIDIYGATVANPNTFTLISTGEELATWVYQAVRSIPHNTSTVYRFGTDSGNYKKLAFVFRYTYVDSSNLTSKGDIKGISGFSGCWYGTSCKSYFANYDHLYDWDRDQKAYFPNDVYGNAGSNQYTYTPSFGNLSGTISSGSPATELESYFDSDAVPTGRVSTAYNNNGSEYGFIFAKGGSNAYGTVLRWTYGSTYIEMVRKQSTWKTTTWEKISAGYADKAGSIATENGSSAGARNVFYAYLGDNTRVVYDNTGSFTYNPSGGILQTKQLALKNSSYTATISNTNGTAARTVILPDMSGQLTVMNYLNSASTTPPLRIADAMNYKFFLVTVKMTHASYNYETTAIIPAYHVTPAVYIQVTFSSVKYDLTDSRTINGEIGIEYDPNTSGGTVILNVKIANYGMSIGSGGVSYFGTTSSLPTIYIAGVYGFAQ